MNLLFHHPSFHHFHQSVKVIEMILIIHFINFFLLVNQEFNIKLNFVKTIAT